MKILVIGSGGREHAIAWKCARSSLTSTVYCAPGNPGTAAFCENIPVDVDRIDQLTEMAVQQKMDLVIVGPEYPLTLGIVDAMRAAGVRVFGPTKEAALLEGSKSFAKEVMKSAGIPTASYETFTARSDAAAYIEQQSGPVVLKADGLAAGKGVFVCDSSEQALAAIEELFGVFKAEKVIVEERLTGNEASYIVATNGRDIVPMAASHDYKRIFDNDKGPNTGGMGTVSPTPNLTLAEEQWVLEHVMQPVVDEMRRRGTPFEGFLYAGLMITPDRGIRVLEFNTRLGDPETQVILRRMDSDLVQLLYALSDPTLPAPPEQRWNASCAVCVVLASAGYPETSGKGNAIRGIDEAEQQSGVVVFHAGTGIDEHGTLVTNGGRVLGVTALGDSASSARDRAYAGVSAVSFEGAQYRRDIARL